MQRLKQEAADAKARCAEAEAALQPSLDELERYRLVADGARTDAEALAQTEAKAKAAADAAATLAKDVVEKARKLNPLSKLMNKLKNKTSKLTMEQVTDCLYDIYEKKLIADLADQRAHREIDTLADFLNDYFLHKYGLQKMANNKMGEFLLGCMQFKDQNKRVQYFLIQVGLERPELYSRNLGDLMSQLLGRFFVENLKAVKETLDEGTEAVTIPRAMSMVIGEAGNRHEPATWSSPYLAKVATPAMIDLLLGQIEGLAGEDPTLDLDDLTGLVIDHCLTWYADAQKKLKSAFVEYDKDSNGFELPDFNQMLTELCHLEIPERVTNKLWSGIAKKAGVDSGVIQDSELFALCCCQRDILPFVEWPEGHMSVTHFDPGSGAVPSAKVMELETTIKELARKNEESAKQISELEVKVENAASSGVSAEAAALLEEQNQATENSMARIKEETATQFAALVLKSEQRAFYTSDIEALLERTQTHLEGLEHLYEVHHDHEEKLAQEVSGLKHQNGELEGILSQVQDKLREMVRVADASPETRDLVSSSLAELKRKDFINESFKANYLVTKMQRTWRRKRNVRILAEDSSEHVLWDLADLEFDEALDFAVEEYISNLPEEPEPEPEEINSLEGASVAEATPVNASESSSALVEQESPPEAINARTTVAPAVVVASNSKRKVMTPPGSPGPWPTNQSIGGDTATDLSMGDPESVPMSKAETPGMEHATSERERAANERAAKEHAALEKAEAKAAREHAALEKAEAKAAREHAALEKAEAKAAREHAALEEAEAKAAREHAALEEAEAKAAKEHAALEEAEAMLKAEAKAAAVAATAAAQAAKEQAELKAAKQIAELKAQLEAANIAAAAASAAAKAEAEERHKAQEAAHEEAITAAERARSDAEAKAWANLEAAETAAAQAQADADKVAAAAAAAIAEAQAQGDATAVAAAEEARAEAQALADAAATKAASDAAASTKAHAMEIAAAEEAAKRAQAQAATAMEASAAEAAAALAAHENAVTKANEKAVAEVAAARSSAQDEVLRKQMEHEKLAGMNEKAAMELLAAQKAAANAASAVAKSSTAIAGKEEAQKVESTGVPASVVKQVNSPSGSGEQKRLALAVGASSVSPVISPKSSSQVKSANNTVKKANEPQSPDPQSSGHRSSDPRASDPRSSDPRAFELRSSDPRSSKPRPSRPTSAQSPRANAPPARRTRRRNQKAPPVSDEVRIAVRHKNTKAVLEASRMLGSTMTKLAKLEAKQNNPAIAKQCKALQKKADELRNEVSAIYFQFVFCSIFALSL